MSEFEPLIIFKSSKTEKKEVAESESLADEEIAEAGALFKRNAQGKENPLDGEEKNRLEELMQRIEKEEDALSPKFEFEKIFGLGTPTEASEHFEIAERYFKRIAELAKTPLNFYGIPEGAYNLALRLEKLRSWKENQKRTEEVFLNLFLKRRKSSLDLHKMAVEGEKNVISGQGARDREELLEKLRFGNISEMEMKKIERLMKIGRGYVLRNVPDYLKEAVIYAPELAEEAKKVMRKIYYMESEKKKRLKERIKYYKGKIQEFEYFKKQWQSQ